MFSSDQLIHLFRLMGFLLVLVALGGTTPARAETGEVGISVLTMGPGDPAFSKFGHNAIVVIESGHPALVYNFGIFSFDSPTLFREFLSGRLRYRLAVDDLAKMLSRYQSRNQSLLLQELQLPESAAHELARALAENALPQNMYYLYDHFEDNCSTRVRDALDRATNGQIRTALTHQATQSYRNNALRLVADDWPIYLALDLMLGPRIDQPMTEWDEAFLPERLAASLRQVSIPGATGNVPLVTREQTIFEAKRKASYDTPPMRAPWLVALGAFLGGMLAWLGRRPSKASRIIRGLLLVLLGTGGGIIGLLLLLLWAATNNADTYWNANIFLCPAVAILLVPIGIGIAVQWRWAQRLESRVTLACFTLSVGGIAFALVVNQNAIRTASLFVPIWLGAWLGTRACIKRMPIERTQ